MLDRWYHTLRWVSLGALLVLSSGCSNSGAAGAESILSIHTLAGSAGYDITPPQACVWLIGRAGGARVILAILAHGGVSVEQCRAMQEVGTFGP